MSQQQAQPEYVSLIQASRIAGRGFRAIKRLISDGKLAAYQRDSNRLYVKAEDARALRTAFTRYVPPATKQKTRRPVVKLHPSVRV